MPPPHLFIIAVNLYLIYVLFKKPRANPRTMYCEEQNTKIVFELDDEPLIKNTFEETYKPKPMPLYSDNYIDESLSKDYGIKEYIPKIEVLSDIVLHTLPEVSQDIVLDIVPEAVPVLAPEVVNTSNNILETEPSIYAKYFTNFDRIAFSQTNIKNYTIVDLLIPRICQLNYLSRVLNEENIINESQIINLENLENKIKIISPNYLFDKNIKYDLIFNSDSMTEIDSINQNKYINFIKENAKYFYSINHESNKNRVNNLFSNTNILAVEKNLYWLRRGYLEEHFKFI